MANEDGIIKRILAKFAPFMLNRTLVFDSLGQWINSRPVIIFHDAENNYYYYIKARDAYSDDEKQKEAFNGEILIEKSGEDNTLFTKDSYLDCSQIFYIHGNQLNELIKKHPKTKILNSKELKFNQVEKIFDKIYECLTSEPPHIVISEVSYDPKRKQTKSDVRYASDWHLKNDYQQAKKKIKKPQKIKQLEELKDRLQKDKDIVELENLEIALGNAQGKYNDEKIYNPLFDWINKNKFIQKGLNSLEIIREYRKLLNPIVPVNVDAEIIFDSLFEKYNLDNKLLTTDYNFMLDWFKKNDLDIGVESFSQFRKSMQKAQGLTKVFYYNELEERLEQELSKIEEKEKQTQNQKTYRDELTYQNLKSQNEKWVQEWEEEWLKEEQTEKFEEPKMKM
ncbi:Mbov_0400 family ICE element protein [Mesomycoplasma ovipneumoniae]|uniref:Mbov_0400 family ICE element protein n=1 Tax=Mesomycoplasma ovipneumoniae TaxID=29562 RepID=UPI002079F274|nr:hypothetical protein [Mesomycoplasma ovipneumoniae]MCN0158402.1 hypothetical protein [Mesomycoplasma ovipneumoniae]